VRVRKRAHRKPGRMVVPRKGDKKRKSQEKKKKVPKACVQLQGRGRPLAVLPKNSSPHEKIKTKLGHTGEMELGLVRSNKGEEKKKKKGTASEKNDGGGVTGGLGTRRWSRKKDNGGGRELGGGTGKASLRKRNGKGKKET